MKQLTIPALLMISIPLLAQDSIPANTVIHQWFYRQAYYDTNGKKKFFRDYDNDGYGQQVVFMLKYNQPLGYVLDSTDCNDSLNSVHPGAPELCNGIDDDCNSQTLEPICDVDVISIVNTGHLINKNIFSGDLEKFCFTGSENLFDVFAPPFFDRIKAIGFTSLTHGNSSPNHWYSVVPGDTNIYNSSCDGYCCVPQAPNFVLDGGCNHYFGVNFYNLAAKLADSLGIPLNVAYNAEYGDTVQLAWMIEQGNVKVVQDGLECYSNGYTNNSSFPDGGLSYRAKMDSTVNKYLDKNYPEIEKGGDSMRPDKAYSTWNAEVNGMNVDFMTRYLFDSMFMPSDCGTTPQEWLACINWSIQYNLPLVIDTFKNDFPGYQMGLYETGLDNTYKKEWYNSMLANLYLVKWYQFLVEYNLNNDDFIQSVVYKSIRSLSLSKADPKNHWLGLKKIGEVFKGDTLFTVQTSIPGVYGFGSEKAIVIANDNDYEVSFTFENNQTPIPSHAIYANDLISTTIIEEDITGTILKRNCISVFHF